MSHDGYYSESSSVENVNDLVNEAQLYRDQALAAATDAALSEAGANTSEVNAGVSESSALAASVSASSSAGTASTAASNAGVSANAAAVSEANAASSASSALASANAAAVSEANAFNSANAAATTLSNAALKSNNLSDLNSIPTAKVNLGIQNVDNTSDANKPVSTATQAALNLKANLASPALTGVPTAPTASPGNSTTQLATTAFVTTADALKAPLASPALTGVPTAPTASLGTNTTQIASTAFVLSELDSLAFTPKYTSPEQVISISSVINLTHGMGASPTLVRLSAICKTTELGYPVGMEIPVHQDANNNSGGATVGWDSTNIRIVMGSGLPAHNAAGALVYITLANWRLIARAW